MTDNLYWLLPQGIEEALPTEAARLEIARRRLIDLYQVWGYELVIPPFIEYLESLLVGGQDLELQTFKLTDQLNGRMMGVRADMTPQVARIDAHRLKREAPTRLCYLGTVLKTRPDDFAGSRGPLQIGAELYGHSGLESDQEILSLMLETLLQSGITDIHLDLGHVGIFRTLASQSGLQESQEAALFDMLQRKAQPEITQWLAELDLPGPERDALAGLSMLHGGRETLAMAGSLVAFKTPLLQQFLKELSCLADHVSSAYPQVEIHFDLAELRGYHYQTGVVFAAYRPGEGCELARGGRYDGIGERFGRARPATGFSADLKTLMRVAGRGDMGVAEKIFAPQGQDDELQRQIKALRTEGKIVIQSLGGPHDHAEALGCASELVKSNNQWVVRKI
jgi:ATP phosphoribosyltransferase regulatory subunit